MHYLAILFIGFCLGALAGLKVGEVLLDGLRRDIKALERRLTAKPDAAAGEPLEDFA